ncbi:MAG: tetratricopeptide repeat protein [Chloroflexi bacterium]|nr:tetratricopeptide repeat protein [Chloroflexota bacterium]MBU1746876.1 tetratricopeptide repeat protein [Chloroflexota bacterium]
MSDNSMLRQQALEAAQAGDQERARALLGSWLHEHPRDDEAWLWLAGLLDSPDQSLAYLVRALTINPANERARAGIVWLQEARRRAAAETATQIEGYLQRGQAYLDRDQIDAAVWEFEAALQRFPDAADLHANLAVAYYQQSRWAEAIRELEVAVRLQPDYADAYYSLGVLHDALGNHEQALTAWQRVLQLDPNHAEARRRLVGTGWNPNETTATPEPDSFFMVCPHCAGEITTPSPTCPHCHHTLFHVCPGCQNLVDLDQRFCPACQQLVPQREPNTVTAASLPTLRQIEAEAQTKPDEPEPAHAKRGRRLPLRTIALIAPICAFWLIMLVAGALGLLLGLAPAGLPADWYQASGLFQVLAAPLPMILMPYPLDRFAPAATIVLALLTLSGTALRAKWAFYANLILPGAFLAGSLIDMFTDHSPGIALVRVVLAAGTILLTLVGANEYEEGDLDQRISASPRDADLYYNRGLLYYKKKRLDDAIAEWYHVIDIRPSDLATRNLLGLALAEQGRFQDALEQLTVAMRIAPQDQNTLNNLETIKKMMAKPA